MTHLAMKEINLGIKLRETSTAVETSLKSLEIQDYFTLQGSPLKMLEPSSKSRGTVAIPGMSTERTKKMNFLEVAVDLNPIDSPTPLDLRLNVSMQPLNVVLSLPAIEALTKVFEVPPSAALTELAAAATKGVDELTKAATQRLKVKLIFFLGLAILVVFRATAEDLTQY